jgi:predicted phosphatase
VHGGGFRAGTRNYKEVDDFCRFFTDQGYVVATMSYRLPLKAEISIAILPLKKKYKPFVELPLIFTTVYLFFSIMPQRSELTPPEL